MLTPDIHISTLALESSTTRSMNPILLTILTTAEPGGTLLEIEAASLERGKGLVGDRYSRGKGSFSKKLRASQDWELTLIESEEIERFNMISNTAFVPGDFRRNLVTRGIRLNELVGRQFTVGPAVLEGIRLCEPCAYLTKFIGTASVKTMAHRAGLRARVVTSGVVRPGDAIAERKAE